LTTAEARLQIGRWAVRQSFGQVVPLSVVCVDERDFLGSPPRFDFFFARDGALGCAMHLEPDKLGDVVFLGEAVEFLFFVFLDAAQQVAGDADVEHA
jgi:hypothetical protein